MRRELRWDGLRLTIPEGMEPVILDRGFVRLACPDRLPACGADPDAPGVRSLELRFGPEGSAFDPARDGRRLLQACGLPDATFAAYGHAHPGAPAVWAAPAREPRLFVVQMPAGLAALLFPAPPPPDTLRGVLGTLELVPADQWRAWQCFDLSFETPPGARLDAAAFRPGAFRLAFRLGGSRLTFDRLAPADVILAGASLEGWLDRFLLREHGAEASITPDPPRAARFASPVPAWRRALPWVPKGAGDIRGQARHDPGTNRILVVSTTGPSLRAGDFERVCAAYEATRDQG
jgi:hypothetical protein